MPTCDIIIPIWNQLEVTKECIDSLERNTSYPYRLLIIDNASDHKTAAYLKGLEKRLGAKVKLIKNEKNEGFIKAVNKGIILSSAESVCILNNDTLVAPGWLGEMIKLFEINPQIGIVNPSSNSLGQRPPKGIAMDEYAGNMKGQSGLFTELGSALGFCMLMKRKLFSRIGRFDEIYGTGNFDDTDISMRAKREGYKTVRAFASYVYHRENTSFNVLGGFEKDFKKNKEIFKSRWGVTKRAIIVIRNINPDSLKWLKDILRQHAKEKSWAYVISPYFETKEIFEQFSNLTFYNYKRLFYTMAFLKILFKKKKCKIIYCDNDFFAKLLAISGMHPGSVIKKVNL